MWHITLIKTQIQYRVSASQAEWIKHLNEEPIKRVVPCNESVIFLLGFYKDLYLAWFITSIAYTQWLE